MARPLGAKDKKKRKRRLKRILYNTLAIPIGVASGGGLAYLQMSSLTKKTGVRRGIIAREKLKKPMTFYMDTSKPGVLRSFYRYPKAAKEARKAIYDLNRKHTLKGAAIGGTAGALLIGANYLGDRAREKRRLLGYKPKPNVTSRKDRTREYLVVGAGTAAGAYIGNEVHRYSVAKEANLKVSSLAKLLSNSASDSASKDIKEKIKKLTKENLKKEYKKRSYIDVRNRKRSIGAMAGLAATSIALGAYKANQREKRWQEN